MRIQYHSWAARKQSTAPAVPGILIGEKMSNEYAAALATHNAAFAKFDAVRTAYRTLKVGDAEFLAAKKEYEAANKAYDAAYTKEATK